MQLQNQTQGALPGCLQRNRREKHRQIIDDVLAKKIDIPQKSSRCLPLFKRKDTYAKSYISVILMVGHIILGYQLSIITVVR